MLANSPMRADIGKLKSMEKQQIERDSANPYETSLWEKHYDENKKLPATMQSSSKSSKFFEIIGKLTNVELTNEALDNTARSIIELCKFNSLIGEDKASDTVARVIGVIEACHQKGNIIEAYCQVGEECKEHESC